MASPAKSRLVSLVEASQQHLLPVITLEKEFEKRELAEAVFGVLDKLKPVEAKIISLHYGLEGEPMTYEEIGQMLWLTRERVKMIEKRAFETLCGVCREHRPEYGAARKLRVYLETVL